MTLTRTDDKLDKNITRLLMQNPIGLTIGDITAAAKCTPQTARKSLARIGAEKDASGQLYLLRDDDEQASEAAPAPEQAAPDPAPEAQMPERSKLWTVNWGGHGFLNPYADTSPTEPTDPAPAAVAEVPEPAAQPELTAAEVVLPPLTGLQQRILTLLGQHRGLTALRIAEDLHADPESVHDALHDLSHLVASRPLALPEIQVWEVRG